MIAFAPYVDGYIDPGVGNRLSIIPRVQFPFKPRETYSRLYEWDYEINPRSIPRVTARTAWTNLITYSEQINNAAWTKTNLTITADNTTAPDGLVTMDKLAETVTNGEHSVSQGATVTNAAHEVSFFIKGGLTRTLVRAAFTDSAATVFSAYFSTSGYTVSPSAGVTTKITGLGNGHFYCVLRFTPAAGAGTLKINVASAVGTISYAGTTTNGIYLWGAQVALGSDAPYIPTTTATRSILAPDRDPLDPMAYLLIESDPEPVNEVRSLVTRTFGRVPLTQIRTGSRSIPKPRIAGTFPRLVNGTLVTQPDEDTPEYLFYSQVAVTTDSGPPSFGITGGDYDVTIGGDTAADIAYNANAGTIQTAVNALSAVSDRNGVVVTGGPTQFLLQFNAWPTATADPSGLTVSIGSPTFVITYETPSGQAAPFRNYVRFKSNHGYTTGGTFTITILGEETAPIDFDATTADVVAAVNALSVIGSGAAVYVPPPLDYSGKPLSNTGATLDFIVAIPFPSASADGSDLTPTGTATITPANGVIDGVTHFGWYLTLAGGTTGTRTLGATGHGVTATDDIILTVGSNFSYLAAGLFSVPNANQITLTSTAGAAFYGGAITAVGKQNGNRYAADSPEIPVDFNSFYFLPGVTPDIEEVRDYPIPARGTPAQLLGAIFGGATLFNYEVGSISEWLDTAVHALTVETINPQHLISPDESV